MIFFKLLFPQFTLAHSVQLHWSISTITYLRYLDEPVMVYPQYLERYISRRSFFGFFSDSPFSENTDDFLKCQMRTNLVVSGYRCSILENYGTNLLIISAIFVVCGLISLSKFMIVKRNGKNIGT